MARILHAADIHLDSPLQKLARYEGAPVDKIRGASRRALEAMADLAIRQQVDLVVIAGDLYDGDWVDQNTGLFFVRIAGQLVSAGIPLVVIRGNHDAANVMTRSLPLPKNPDGSGIVLSAKRPETRVFDSIDVAVHGRSFPTRAVTENLAVDYPSPHNGYFNLGLLHTALTGAEGHDTYSPCTPEYLTQKGYDYWALGHIHTPADHALEGGPPIVFPGNLQGRHAGECGARGCRIIEFDASGKLKQQFHCIDLVRWERCQLDVSSIDHVDDVADLYRDYLEAGLAAAMNSDASGSFENAFAAAL
ncbi:MAG: DNA repair exonuclease, partial [Planctomycetota bacterium]